MRRRPPSVSVIIPCWNARAHIARQLDALSKQSYGGDVEVIVVDNGSSDGSQDVVSSYVEMVPRLRLVTAIGQRGPAHARNVGAMLASGDLLLFCDADDIVEGSWIDRMVKASQLFDIVGGDAVTDHETFSQLDPSRRNVLRPIPALQPGSRQPPFISSSNLGAWRDVHEALRGFDEELATAEDVDYSIRGQLVGLRVGICNATIYYRRRPSAMAVFRQEAAYARGSVQVRSKHRDVLARRPLVSVVSRWVYWLGNTPRALVNPLVRMSWAKNLGNLMGHVYWSVRLRAWYP